MRRGPFPQPYPQYHCQDKAELIYGGDLLWPAWLLTFRVRQRQPTGHSVDEEPKK